MKVSELIAELSKQNPDIDVVYWDHEEDDWVEVVEAVQESGTSHVALSHIKHDWVEGPASE